MEEGRKQTRAEARAHLAATVKRLMREKQLSLVDLARRAEVDQRGIELVLQGEAEADVELVYRLAGALGVEPRRLFEGIAWHPDEAGGGRLEIDPGEI